MFVFTESDRANLEEMSTQDTKRSCCWWKEELSEWAVREHNYTEALCLSFSWRNESDWPWSARLKCALGHSIPLGLLSHPNCHVFAKTLTDTCSWKSAFIGLNMNIYFSRWNSQKHLDHWKPNITHYVMAITNVIITISSVHLVVLVSSVISVKYKCHYIITDSLIRDKTTLSLMRTLYRRLTPVIVFASPYSIDVEYVSPIILCYIIGCIEINV